MRVMRLKNNAFSTKMCCVCGEKPCTHRLTWDDKPRGYCYQCAKEKAERVNAKESSESEYATLGEETALHKYGVYY